MASNNGVVYHSYGCREPGRCECHWGYHPGCLHTLQPDECPSPEMDETRRIYGNYFRVSESLSQGVSLAVFWDGPNTRSFLQLKMVRFIVYMAIKAATMSVEESFDGDADRQRKIIKRYLGDALFVMAAIKCGNSMTRAVQLYKDVLQFKSVLEGESSSCLRGYTKSEKNFAFAWDSITDCLTSTGYGRGGLFALLQRFAPCDCLRSLAREETTSFCGKCWFCMEQEPSPGAFSICSSCKFARYCSRDCQLEHWRIEHKRCCKGIPKILDLDVGEW